MWCSFLRTRRYNITSRTIIEKTNKHRSRYDAQFCAPDFTNSWSLPSFFSLIDSSLNIAFQAKVNGPFEFLWKFLLETHVLRKKLMKFWASCFKRMLFRDSAFVKPKTVILVDSRKSVSTETVILVDSRKSVSTKTVLLVDSRKSVSKNLRSLAQDELSVLHSTTFY